MTNFQEAKVKLTNTQLNKSNSAAKNKTENIKNKEEFQDEEFPHELFLTTRRITKIRNAFPNNMSTDIKLSKAQRCKIIQSGWFLCNILSNLG